MINNKQFTKVGIIGFGGYVPSLRIKIGEIAEAYGKSGEQVTGSLGVKQKAVAKKDEDTVSLAVEAIRTALLRTEMDKNKIGAVLIGSESHPYSVKPTGSMVGEILGLENEYLTADLEFACKAGTSGLILIAGLIEAGLIEAGIAVGADVAQSRPGDALEYTAGAGAGAIILGNKKFAWLAKLNFVNSLSSDTPDFWRREGQQYPSHAGRFTAGPAYFKHVIGSTQRFLAKTRTEISAYQHVVLHMPNVKFPQRAGVKLGVTKKQLDLGFLVPDIGNPYSASSLLGLINVLEQGEKGEKVLVTSYGSGAGSDNFSLQIEKRLIKDKFDLKSQFKKIEYINYAEYLKLRQGKK
ncbi:MAG: hydroxymethylglutaryl-CoA synthase [Patescibacteria group bacterium]|nr:hydroxymethylglutaryl-CoA synthase [Patescibacteria group bacterium]